MTKNPFLPTIKKDNTSFSPPERQSMGIYDDYAVRKDIQTRELTSNIVTLKSRAKPTTQGEGEMWIDSTQKAIQTYFNGINQWITTSIYSMYSSTTIANTLVERTLFGSSGIGTLTIPANFFKVGKTIRIRLRGHISTIGNPTVRLKVKLGSTTVLDGTAIALLGSALANDYWELECGLTCRSVGSSGTVQGSGMFIYDKSTQSANAISLVNTSTTTINTTTSQTIDATFTWGTASASNTITSQNASVEILC